MAVPFGLTLCMTVYRMPRLVARMRTALENDLDRTALVFYIFSEFCQLIIDLPSIALGVVMCCTWRSPWVISRMRQIINDKKNTYISGNDYCCYKPQDCALRTLPFKELVLLVWDIPAMICLPLCLTPWRALMLSKKITELRGEFNDEETTHAFYFFFNTQIIIHGLSTLVDIAAAVMCVAMLFVCPWRMRVFVRKMRAKPTNQYFQFHSFVQLGQGMIDWPCILAGVITSLLGFWRIQMLYIALTASHEGKWIPHARVTCFHQLGLVFLDIPCFVAAALVFVTGWRAYPLYYGLVRLERDADWGGRARHWCCTQLLRLGVDMLLVVPELIIILTIWRAKPLFKATMRRHEKLQNKDKPNNTPFFQDVVLYKNAHTILKQLLKLFIDFFIAITFLIVFLTLWRAWPLYKRTKKKIKKCRKRIEEDSKALPAHHHHDPSDVINTKYTESKGARNVDFQDMVLSLNTKTILLQFGMLFIDLMVMPLAIFLLFTWRSLALVSGLIGSGDFFGMFAITVLTEFGRFLIDIPCIVWFTLMLVLRPYGSLTLLLEDTRHKRRRVLVEKMGEMRDICRERHALFETLDDIADTALKLGVIPCSMSHTQRMRSDRSREYGDGSLRRGQRDYFVPLYILTETTAPYLDKLTQHKQATKGLSDNYTHLLNQVCLIEEKRPRKLMRRYHSEWQYMCRPDLAVHKVNMELTTKEMVEFDAVANDAFTDLFEYTPPTRPLWKRESGFSSRTRSELFIALIEIATTGYFAALFLFTLNTLLLYRVPSVVMQLYNHWWDRHRILRRSLVEYAKDFGALCCVVLVTCTVYHALEMYSDMTTAIVVRRSWSHARTCAFNASTHIASDFLDLITFPFRWSTYSFFLLALLWGLLVPIDLLQPTFGMVVGVVLWLSFTSFPFAFSTKLAAMIADPVVVDVSIATFLAILIIVLLIVTSRSKKGTFKPPPQFKYFRLNSDNINTMMSEVLEFLQIAALTLQIGIPVYYEHELKDIAGYFLFAFIPTNVVFWMMITIFVLWYFVASAPHILEDVMKVQKTGRISQKVLWQLAIRFFTDTLFITMAEACLQLVKCEEGEYETSNGTTVLESHVVGDESLHCWHGEHRVIGGFALFALTWYTVTGILYNANYRLSSTRHDFQFSSLYLILLNLLKLAMVVVATLLRNYKLTVVLLLGIFNLVAALLTIGFRGLTGYTACNAWIPLVWKAGAFAAATWLSVCAVIALEANHIDPVIAPIMCVCGWAVLVVGLIVFSFKYRKASEHETARGKFKETLLTLQTVLENRGSLLHCEKEIGREWRSKVANVTDAKWICVEALSEMNYVVHVEGDLVCPITMDLLEDPVRSPYGHHFERSAIEYWLRDHTTCPLTRQPLTVYQLTAADADVLSKLARVATEASSDLQHVMLKDKPLLLTELSPHTGGGRWGPRDNNNDDDDDNDDDVRVETIPGIWSILVREWRCPECTFDNPPSSTTCAMCEYKSTPNENDNGNENEVGNGHGNENENGIVGIDAFGRYDERDCENAEDVDDNVFARGLLRRRSESYVQVIDARPCRRSVSMSVSTPVPVHESLTPPSPILQPTTPPTTPPPTASPAILPATHRITIPPPPPPPPPPPCVSLVEDQQVAPIPIPIEWPNDSLAHLDLPRISVAQLSQFDEVPVKVDHPYTVIGRMLERKHRVETAAYDGQSVLLELEQRIRYDCLPFRFLVAREKWREAVQQSSWIGLVECTSALQKALDDADFKTPSHEWRHAAAKPDLLQRDWDEIMLPPFVNRENESDEVIEQRSSIQRATLIQALTAELPYASEVVQLFDRVFPTKIIDTWCKVEVNVPDNVSRQSLLGHEYHVDLVHDGRGKVTKVDDTGVKMAINAQVKWQESVVIKIEKLRKGILFDVGNLKVGKGPISITVSRIRLARDGDKFECTYNKEKTANVNLQKAMGSVAQLTWS